jgi:hypothetical protein
MMQPGISRRPVIASVAVGVAVLALYTVTLAPGLIAIEDTPKFQFVGRVLGTAHPPGYPLYVVLSHLFGRLPFGNLAWRINLMSAVCAALTVLLFQLALAELEVSTVVAAVAGLGLATGSGFWFAATIAEVYSLHGCLVAAMTWTLLRWRRTGRSSWFFAAIGVFSMGLGHHTSIVMIGPAVAIFAIVTAPRFALGPRTIAGILTLFAAGFAQYLFVLVRTGQGAWGESPASNLSELFDVVRGARWASYVAPVTFGTIAERGPTIVGLLTREVSLPVMGAALAGIAVAAVRDRPMLALAFGSITGVVAFATFFSGQSDGFLQPAYAFLWLLGAVGMDAAWKFIPGPRRAGSTIAALPLIGVVIWHVTTNINARDLSHRRFDMRYFDALSNQLPPHSGLVAEDFLVDRMVLYQKFSENTFTVRDIVAQVEATPNRVSEYAARGYGLFAFTKNAARLRTEGLDFEYAPWPMEYGSIRQFLVDQPRGTVVALAVPAMRLGAAIAADAVPLDVIGGRGPKPSWSNLTAIGVVGRPGALQSEAEKNQTSVFAGRGLGIGATRTASPADILAEAVYDRASIRIGSREIIRSSGSVVALWTPRGEFAGAFALRGAGQVPMPDSPLGVHRLRAIRRWTRIGESPTDMKNSAASGHLIVRQGSPTTPTIVYAARARALAPRLFETSGIAGELRVQAFEGAGDDLSESLSRDGWPPQPNLRTMNHVYRIELPRSLERLHLSFGGIPDVALSQWAGAGEPPAFLGIDLTGQLERVDEGHDRLHVARDHHQFFLGAGWSAISADETGGYCITTGMDAEVLLPCEVGACSSVDLQLWTTADRETVRLAVNDTLLPLQPLHAGWNMYRWTVPAAALHPGMNSFVVEPSTAVRLGDILIAKALDP